MQITYTKLITELSTKKITFMNICHLIDKCSHAIDDLGCEILSLYEQLLRDDVRDIYDTDIKTLKHQQKHIITIRDTLLNAYMDSKDLKHTHKSNRGMIEGVARYGDQ